MSTNSTGINNLLLWVWNQFCSEAPEASDPDYLLNLDRRQEELFTSLPFNSLFSLSTGLLFLLAPSEGQAPSRVPCCRLWEQVIGSHDPRINKCQSENEKKKREWKEVKKKKTPCSLDFIIPTGSFSAVCFFSCSGSIIKTKIMSSSFYEPRWRGWIMAFLQITFLFLLLLVTMHILIIHF